MVTLDGDTLTIESLANIARRGLRVRIDPKKWKGVSRAKDFVSHHQHSKKALYGINTGFGALSQVRINRRDLTELQHNILLSHHAGVGAPFAKELVRAAIALRINTLIKGYSGVSRKLITSLTALLNKDIIPLVPMKGSVGASGDLAPMAALGLVLVGKSSVFYKGRQMPSSKALRLAGMKPLVLQPKEGLSLINGTQFSCAIAALVNIEGRFLCDTADLCGALSLDALRNSVTPFDPRLFTVRPQPGAQRSARNIRNLLRGSEILHSHAHCPKVQDPYSLRCLAQVHGAVRDLYDNTRKTITIEMNSVTDNPIIFADQNAVISGGNFHGESIAFSSDMMAIGLAELASISERRIYRLLDSKLSGLNPFLTKKPGLNSGFMMSQVTAAALVSQNKILCHPASVDSIPTSAGQEDHVSMSMNAGLKALEVLQNTRYVLAIELLCACQAIDLLKPLKTSPGLERIKTRVRQLVPFIETDRPLTPLIESLKNLISKQQLRLD
ncbi:MAG TPA: histidine ammonia-lyase [bacterium]